ncbi:hypothetical protein [Tamlana sp. I1]|uniref:hypothetical protein n=1 Tax=Tamlana sp. I1 TaxID=2762061 RepID=UPI00188E24D2|nr:hypothetical protein [Tamlana sp. I1]
MSQDLQNPQPQQSEEVDLGQLFKLIGKAFDRFFKFIASIFIGIYKVILLLLVHIYSRFVWYAGAVVVGVVLGFFIDKNTDKMYGANMFIETNFKSARQVYENVKQLHQLAEDEDTLQLGKILNIDPSKATKLKGFYITPDVDENEISEMYSEFYLKLDSLSRVTMTYDRYKESLISSNFPMHKIGVASTDKSIYKKIEQGFTNKLIDNPYLEELLQANNKVLIQEEQALKTQINKTDSLVTQYLKIRVLESQKEPVQGSGTNLYMGDSESNGLLVDESKIIEKRLALERQRREVIKRQAEEKGVVNVLAGFPETGYDIREWTDKMKFVLPIALFSIIFLFFIVLGLGKFLKSQTQK